MTLDIKNPRSASSKADRNAVSRSFSNEVQDFSLEMVPASNTKGFIDATVSVDHPLFLFQIWSDFAEINSSMISR